MPASPKVTEILITVAGVPTAGLTPTFVKYRKTSDGITWSDATPVPAFVDVGGGLYAPLITPLPGYAVAGLIDYGATADGRYSPWGFRFEDYNEDLIAPAEGSVTLAPLILGSGVAGPELIIPQNQSFSIAIAAVDSDGNPVNLTGKTVRLLLCAGVPGGGQTFNVLPVAIKHWDGVNRSPATLGISDVAIAAADTVGIPAGSGYVYGAITVEDGALVISESPATISRSLF